MNELSFKCLNLISFCSDFAFNDVVQAPPSLKQLEQGRKPGQSGTLVMQKQKQSMFKTTKKGGVGMSMAKRARMEEERERVVREYREMKKGKMNKVKI